MAVYGAILGAMEQKGMEIAAEMNDLINEKMLRELPIVAVYLESYSALDVHVMIRFGRWQEILELALPADEHLMLYRSASIAYGKALAYAALGSTMEAWREHDRLENLRKLPEAEVRILHNNSVASILAVDSVMVRGEIMYREGKYVKAFALLREAVQMQDDLMYDEPWGKMQPIRHALGGLLLEQGQVVEAAAVFRRDLDLHPNNPWALVGLIQCLRLQALSSDDTDMDRKTNCCTSESKRIDVHATASSLETEVHMLQGALETQRQQEWADFEVVVPCACCQCR
jgi:tetratricopeptide (TPR) repeat protein